MKSAKRGQRPVPAPIRASGTLSRIVRGNAWPTDTLRIGQGLFVVALGVVLGFGTAAGVQSVLLVMAALSIYAAAYGVLLGYANQPSLGQSLFFGLGAYSVVLPMSRSFGGFWQGILLALTIGGLVGAIVGALVSRMSQANHVIVTALFATVAGVAAQAFSSITGGSGGLSFSLATVAIGPFSVNATSLLQQYLLVLALAALSFLLLYFVVRSPIGLAWKALRENEARVSSIGHNTLALKVAAYAICSGFTALSGGLYAFSQQYANSDYFSLSWSVLPFLWVLIGGRGTLLGPLIGVILFYIFQFYVSQYWANYLILFGLVILAILRWQSDGLVGYGRVFGSWLWERFPRRQPPVPDGVVR